MIAQLKVEEWLAAVPPPYPIRSTFNIESLTNGETNGNIPGKDFYGKVLELYILSLLPRNEEWEFANTFIGMNEYLSDSKKRVLSLEILLTTDISCKIGRPQISSRKRKDKTTLTKTILKTITLSKTFP